MFHFLLWGLLWFWDFPVQEHVGKFSIHLTLSNLPALTCSTLRAILLASSSAPAAIHRAPQGSMLRRPVRLCASCFLPACNAVPWTLCRDTAQASIPQTRPPSPPFLNSEWPTFCPLSATVCIPHILSLSKITFWVYLYMSVVIYSYINFPQLGIVFAPQQDAGNIVDT